MAEKTVIDGFDDLEVIYEGVKRSFDSIHWTELLGQFDPILEEEHKLAFDEATSQAGDQWADLSPRTIRAKGHDRILIDTDRMRQSLTGRTGDSIRQGFGEGKLVGFLWGTAVPYAMFHMTGTERMPDRQHVGVSNDTVDEFAELTADYVLDQIRGPDV